MPAPKIPTPDQVLKDREINLKPKIDELTTHCIKVLKDSFLGGSVSVEVPLDTPILVVRRVQSDFCGKGWNVIRAVEHGREYLTFSESNYPND